MTITFAWLAYMLLFYLCKCKGDKIPRISDFFVICTSVVTPFFVNNLYLFFYDPWK